MRPPDLSLLANGPFTRFWTYRFTSVIAYQIQATALGWMVYDLARDAGRSVPEAAFILGAIGLVQFLPLLGLSLVGGQAADRYNRKTILIITGAARAVLALGLIGASLADPAYAIPLLFLAAGISGALSAFAPAAAAALLPLLVPRPQLPAAIAWNSLAFTLGTVMGPALGGLLYGLGGATAFQATFALTLLGLAVLCLTPTPRQAPVEGARTLDLIREGLIYIRDNRIVLGAISLDLVVVLLAGAQAMLPVFARDVLHVGPEGLGVLRAAPAAGAALIGLALVAAPLRQNVGRWMFAGVFVFSAATVVFGASTLFWVSAAALFAAGAADMFSVYVRQSLIQLATPDAMRGRVAAVSFICISASNELGDFEAGVMARLFGPGLSVILGGLGGAAVAAAWWRLFPQLAKADAFEDAGQYAAGKRSGA